MNLLKLSLILLSFSTHAIANDISINLNGSHFGYILPYGVFSTEDSEWHKSDIAGDIALSCDLKRNKKVTIGDKQIYLFSNNIKVSKNPYAKLYTNGWNPDEYSDEYKINIKLEGNRYGLTEINCYCARHIQGVCQEEVSRLPLSVPKKMPEWSEATYGD